VATRQEQNLCPQQRQKNPLTPTGLLMEGVLTSLRRLFAGKGGMNVMGTLHNGNFTFC
jgi:hypothetical protein